jgi:hypothetical protein
MPQDHDGSLDPGPAQLQALLNGGHAEGLDLLGLKLPADLHCPVAIGICLDHCTDGHGTWQKASKGAEVVGYGI